MQLKSGYRYRILVGYLTMAALGSVALGLKLWFGTWAALGAFALKVLIGLVATAVVTLIALVIGSVLWESYDSDYRDAELQSGLLKGTLEDWLEKREKAAAAKLAAAKQDGQLSEAVDARGRVSLPERNGIVI